MKSWTPRFKSSSEAEIKYKELIDKIDKHLQGYPMDENQKESALRLFCIDAEICTFKNMNRHEGL